MNNKDPDGKEPPKKILAFGDWQGREIRRLDCGGYASMFQPAREGQVMALQEPSPEVYDLSLWDYRQDRIILSIRLAEETAVHAAFADHTRLLGISSDDPPTVSLYELPSQKVIRHFRGHYARVTDLAVHPDGRRMLTVSQDANCIVWDLQARAEEDGIVGVFEGHTAIGPEGEALAVAHLAVSPDGLHAASADDFGNILVWDIDKQAEIARLPARYSRTSSVISFWESEGKIPPADFFPDPDCPESLRFLPDSRHLAIGRTGRIMLIDAQTGQEIWSSPREIDQSIDGQEMPCCCGVNDIAVSPDGRWLAFCTARHPVRIVDVRNRRIIGSVPGHEHFDPNTKKMLPPPGHVDAVSFTPDRGHLLTAGSDGTIRLWELRLGVRKAE